MMASPIRLQKVTMVAVNWETHTARQAFQVPTVAPVIQVLPVVKVRKADGPRN